MSMPGGGFRVLHIMPDGPERSRETYDFYLPYTEPTDEQWRLSMAEQKGTTVAV